MRRTAVIFTKYILYQSKTAPHKRGEYIQGQFTKELSLCYTMNT